MLEDLCRSGYVKYIKLLIYSLPVYSGGQCKLPNKTIIKVNEVKQLFNGNRDSSII